MNARFYAYAARLIIFSLIAVAPGAFSATPTSTVQFITDVYGRNENAGDAALTVIRNGDTNTSCSVNWSVTGGSAAAPNDYSPMSGTLNFAAGETFRNISLLIVDDALVESNETVHLTLSSAVNTSISFPSNAVLTIFDNDVSNPPPASVVQFITDVYGRNENAGDASLTVTRSGDTSNACSVNWSVTGGSATPGVDYNPSSGTLNFAAFETFKNISLFIVDDALVESNETVNLTLSGAMNATIGYPSNAVLTIFDNDVTPSADLQITKSANSNFVSVGQTVVFQLALFNSGPNNLSNSITVSEVIPSGFQYVSDTSAASGTTYSAGLGQWTIPNGLGSGSNIFLNITVQAINTGLHTNRVTVNVPPGVNDPNTNNNSSSVVVTVINPPPAQADLQITKTASASGLPIGSNVVFNLVLWNNGPATVTNQVVVTEVIPSGFDYVSDNSGGSGNFYSFGLGQWVMPTGLVAGAMQSVAITVRALTTGTYTNTAIVNVPNGVTDPNTNNNSSFVVVIVSNPPPVQADLQITKTASTNSVRIGSNAVFTLTLKNNGPGTVTNQIVVNDAMPAGFDYVSESSSGGGFYSFGLGQWVLPNGIANGATQTVAITVRAITLGTYTNTATINVPPGVNDSNPANNSSSVVVTVTQPQADLRMTKTASTNSVRVGEQVVFTLTLSNAGPDNVTNQITVSEMIPSGFQYVRDNSAATFTTYSAGAGLWTIFNGRNAGTAISLILTVQAVNAGTYTNTATINVPAAINDTNSANNSSSVIVTNVQPKADLQITKTVNTNSILANQPVTFGITVSNRGPDTATNIVVQESLPAGVTITGSNVPPGTTYNGASGVWNIPGLANAASTSLTLTAVKTTPGTVTNVATITSSGSTDTNLLNNTNSAAVTWLSTNRADLCIAFSQMTNSVLQGQTATIEFAVTNLGPNDASNIVIYAPLPPGATFVSQEGGGNWMFNPATGVWTRNLLVSGIELYFGFTVRFTNAGTFAVAASITNSQPPDLVTNNNYVASNITVMAALDVNGQVKCATNGPAFSGVTITLTSSNQPTRTTVTDPNGGYTFTNVPPGFYTVTPSTNGFGFSPSNQIVNVQTFTNLPPFIATARFIFGSVLAGTNGSGLPGIAVQLTGAASTTVFTDTNGMFIFTNLNAGNYTVKPLTSGVPNARFTPTNANFALGNPTNCTNSVTFYLTNKIVVLRALEVVQVSQDWVNSVPLVADKKTLVRAHLQLPGTNTTPVDVRGARLWATNLASGARTSWAPTNRNVLVISNDAAYPPLRSNIAATLNFPIPDFWRQGRMEYRLEWTNGVLIPIEPAETGGLASNASVRVSYTNMPDFGVRFIKVAWTNALTNKTATMTNYTLVTNAPTAADLVEQRRRVISIYPIVRFETLDGYLFWSATNGAPDDDDQLLAAVEAARITSTDTNGSATNRIWYGLTTKTDIRGVGYLGGRAAIGKVSDSPNDYQRHLAAHEIGHALSRPHAAHSSFGRWRNSRGMTVPGTTSGRCEEQARNPVIDFPMFTFNPLGLMPTLGPISNDNFNVWGYDHYLNQVISPYYSFDLMSYCHNYASMTPWPWISKYTYTNIQNSILGRFGTNGALPPALHLVKSLSPYMLIRGEVNLETDLVQFRPCYPIAAGTLPVPAPGDYLLRLVDGVGQPLLDIPFEPESPMIERSHEPIVAHFNIEVPVMPAAAGAIVFHGGIPIGTIGASANAPSVQVIQPNGGEVFGATGIPALWSGFDADADALHYLVQFSPNGGAQWTTIAIDLEGTTLDIPNDVLAATSHGKIRVIVSDGFRFNADDSNGEFVILNHGPAAAILSPAPGDLYFGEQSIVFSANANDLEDGELSGTNLVWWSDRDGLLGTGGLLLREVNTLSEGAHLITLTARDSGGLTNAVTVTMSVSYEEPPSLNIALDTPDAVLWWSLNATNYHLQRASSLPGSWSNVTNAVELLDDRVQIKLPASDPRKFFRLIKP